MHEKSRDAKTASALIQLLVTVIDYFPLVFSS